jgi:hypothetical protein
MGLGSREPGSDGLQEAGYGVFENHRDSETQKCRFYKGLGCGKGFGITHIGIVNARESEAHRIPRLTDRCATVPWEGRYKGRIYKDSLALPASNGNSRMGQN